MMISVKKQNGAALIIGLLMLLVMTLLGVSSMSTTTTSLKMSVNTQIQNSGFQAAETALKQTLVPHPDPVKRIDWDDYSGTIFNVESIVPLPNTNMSATIQYLDCDPNPIGESRRKGLVHEITGTGSITNSAGKVISTNIQVMGVQSLAASCADQ